MNQLILPRKQIDFQLKEMFDHPLTLVTAAMGYGKTTAVRHFLDQYHTRYLWLNVETDETSAPNIWHSLTRQLTKIEPAFGKQLNTLGFPSDSAQRERVLDYIEDHVYGTNTVMVLDDYHHVYASEVDELMERIVRKAIPGFHVVLISRVRPRFGVEELVTKGLCLQLKNVLFELSSDEILEFFRLYGYDLSDDSIMQVYEVTEGWITAVYLMMKSYAETGTFDYETDINSLLEQAIITQYTMDETNLLAALSYLDSFTPRQAVFVTGMRDAAKVIRKICCDNSLIHYNGQAGNYKMHNILVGYLQENWVVHFQKYDLAGFYRRAGEWEVKNHNLLAGLQYFLKAKEYDLILKEFEKPGITRVIDTAPIEIVAIFEQVPKEVRYRHPMGYITYADFFLTDIDMEAGTQLLDEIELYYSNNPGTSLTLKRQIFGEITLVRSFSHFNDMRKMSELHVQAYELLGGRSSIANRDMVFTFGSPHSQYLFYREKGDLWGITEYSDRAIRYYQELSDGCGAGFGHLSRAEYYLETGSLDQVEPYARKAIYKAQTMDQLSVILCARFTLARWYAARGQFVKARKELCDLSVMVEESHNPILNSTLELCYGYLGGILGDATDFTSWLREGDMQQSDIFYQGMGFNYLVHAKYVLLEADYLKLEMLCEQLCQVFSIFNNLLGYVHAYILEAIAKEKTYGFTEAKETLLLALDIGRADGLILPFAEYGMYIGELLQSLHQENPGDEYLGKLDKAAEQYRKNLQHYQKDLKKEAVLTPREKEILCLVIEGNTNREIADRLFIAQVTVKKTVTSIYRKLEVNGRAAAVRKALELGLDAEEASSKEDY